MSDSATSVTWVGLDELKAFLKTLPDDLTEDAMEMIRGTGHAALADIRAAYPVWTGTLQRGLRVTEAKTGRYAGAIRVRSTAPHSSLFEKGTKPRRAFTRDGKWMKKPANRGFMPAAGIFVPIAMRHRARMWLLLKQLVRAQGFVVNG
jgi:Bacteriophage HK97-gp10, putative tail-component